MCLWREQTLNAWVEKNCGSRQALKLFGQKSGSSVENQIWPSNSQTPCSFPSTPSRVPHCYKSVELHPSRKLRLKISSTSNHPLDCRRLIETQTLGTRGGLPAPRASIPQDTVQTQVSVLSLSHDARQISTSVARLRASASPPPQSRDFSYQTRIHIHHMAKSKRGPAMG